MKKGSFQQFVKHNLESFADHIFNTQEYGKLVEKMRNLDIKKFVERVLEVTHLSKEDILVLGHGDMWVNNLMF